MKKRNQLKIGEKEFLEDKNLEQGYYQQFKTLRECYEKWSDTKESIFNIWKNNLNDNCNLLKYGIRSYNANFIVLHALVEQDNKNYYLMITPRHSYYKEV